MYIHTILKEDNLWVPWLFPNVSSMVQQRRTCAKCAVKAPLNFATDPQHSSVTALTSVCGKGTSGTSTLDFLLSQSLDTNVNI